MKVYLGADHAGFDLKNKLVGVLEGMGHTTEDCGAFTLDPLDDYPDFVVPCAKKVAADPGSHGIVIGGSGQGEAIAANRIPGVRALLYYGGNLDIVKLARLHNDANVLSLGARMMTDEEAIAAVKLWLETPFSGDERHVRRISKF